MLFSPKILLAKDYALPQVPQEFAEKLIEWGEDSKHENASLILSPDVLDFMRGWALSYYSDSCLIVVLREVVVIGSYIPVDGETMVVLDELLLTYPDHKLIYNRRPGKPSFITGIHIAHLELEEGE